MPGFSAYGSFNHYHNNPFNPYFQLCVATHRLLWRRLRIGRHGQPRRDRRLVGAWRMVCAGCRG